MAYIVQNYTWSTGDTITAVRLNSNISDIISGLNGGTKDINVAKLQIAGVDIIDGSENITNSGDITGTSATASKPLWTLKNTNSDANSSELQFYKLSVSPGDNDDVGLITFYGDDDGANKTLYAKILAESSDVTDTTEDGKLSFFTMTAGTSTETLTLESSNVTIAGTTTLTGAVTLSSTLTDGTATLTSGAWSGITTLAMTGALSGVTNITLSGTLTDGTASLTSGAWSGVTNITLGGGNRWLDLGTNIIADGVLTGNWDFGTGNITSGGIIKIDVDGTAENAAGSLTLGAGNDAGIFFDGTDLVIITNGAGASGIKLDSEDDTVEILGSGVSQATFSTSGLNLVSGDDYSINSTSVLNATTLGSGVTSSSLTSVGTLTSLTVDNVVINGNDISSSSGNLTLTPVSGSNITLDGNVTIDGGDIIDYVAVNDGNPQFRIGATDSEEFHIQTVYDSGTQTLDYVLFQTDAASATADKGEYRFNVDGTVISHINDSGINVVSGLAYYINDTSVLNSTTLGSSVVSSSLTSVGTLSSLTVSGDVTIDTNTLFVDSVNNKVGIGTATPVTSFQVTGASNSEIMRIGNLGSEGVFGGGYPYNSSNAYTFGNASDFKNIEPNASVGLGIVSPMRTATSTTTGGIFVADGNASADTTYTFASLIPAITWQSDGSIGIGIESATSILHISSATPVLQIEASTDTNSTMIINAGATSDAVVKLQDNGTDVWSFGMDASWGNNDFSLSNSATLGTSERMNIDTSGNVQFKNDSHGGNIGLELRAENLSGTEKHLVTDWDPDEVEWTINPAASTGFVRLRGQLVTGTTATADIDLDRYGIAVQTSSANKGFVMTELGSSHGMTTLVTDDDTYMRQGRQDGLEVWTYSTGVDAYTLTSVSTGSSTSITTSATGCIQFKVGKKSGTTAQDLAADDNMMVLINNGSGSSPNATHIFKGDGDLYIDGVVIAFDSEDDIKLVETIRNTWKGDFTLNKYTKRLEELGIMTNGFMSTKKMHSLHLGVVGQLFNVIKGLGRDLGYDETKLLEMSKEYA